MFASSLGKANLMQILTPDLGSAISDCGVLYFWHFLAFLFLPFLAFPVFCLRLSETEYNICDLCSLGYAFSAHFTLVVTGVFAVLCLPV